MKGGRIALPIEYFSETQSGNYTEENGNNYQSRAQENCTDSFGPNLEVQNGAGMKKRKQRSRQQRRASKRRSQRQRQQRRGSKQRQQRSRRQRQQRRGSKQRSQKRRQQRRN